MGWEENLSNVRKYAGRYWKAFKCNESGNILKKNVFYKPGNLELSKPYAVNQYVLFLGPRQVPQYIKGKAVDITNLEL